MKLKVAPVGFSDSIKPMKARPIAGRLFQRLEWNASFLDLRSALCALLASYFCISVPCFPCLWPKTGMIGPCQLFVLY